MEQVSQTRCNILGVVSFAIAFLFVSYCDESISPFMLSEGTDSCVFKQMGLVILQGKTPYIDFFDHKGPILYYINALGIMLGGRWGLFVINVLNLTFVIYCWHTIARQFCPNKTLLPVLTALVLYMSIMSEGNLTEDWCLLPLSYSLYLATKIFSQKVSISKWESLTIGICAGIIVFIRANNVALLICSSLFILYVLYKGRLHADILRFFSFSVAGFFIVVFVIFVLFYVKYGVKGINGMIYGTFIFNIYDYPHSKYFFNLSFSNSTLYLFFYFLSILLCAFSYINNLKKENNRVITIFLALSFFFCFSTIGKLSFNHYLITLLPLYLMCISYAFRDSRIKYVLCSIIGMVISFPSMKHRLSQIMGKEKRDLSIYYSQADRFMSTIYNSYPGEFWNYNTNFMAIIMLQKYSLVQTNRIVHNFQYDVHSINVSEKGMLQLAKPQYIVMYPSGTYHYKEDSLWIHTNYKKCDSFQWGVEIYKRN